MSQFIYEAKDNGRLEYVAVENIVPDNLPRRGRQSRRPPLPFRHITGEIVGPGSFQSPAAFSLCLRG